MLFCGMFWLPCLRFTGLSEISTTLFLQLRHCILSLQFSARWIRYSH